MTSPRPPVAGVTLPGPAVHRARRVAWPTVLVLAASLAYADMFWVVSLREAAGAIERTAHPFTAWLRESALLLPTYVVAVLGARQLIRRRDRTRPPNGGTGTTALTLIALVALGTGVGVLALAASSFYDYRLELALLEHVSHAGCVGDCLDAQRTSTAELQLSSVGQGSAIILATNVVVTGWLVAAMGGRLRLDLPDTSPRGATRSVVRQSGPFATVAAWSLAGAAVVHAAVVPAHAAQWPTAGAFFVVLACLQGAAAAAVLLRPGRASWGAAALVSATPLGVWVVSRTVALPWGPGAGGGPEPAGPADLAVVGLQLITLVALGTGARRWRHRPADRVGLAPDGERIAVAMVVAVTALGLGGTGVGGLDVTGEGAHAGPAVEQPAPGGGPVPAVPSPRRRPSTPHPSGSPA